MKTSRSYGQILKSSSIMGGAAGVTFLLGMLRTKVAALLIGTSGVGLIGGFTAIQSLISTVAGLGIQSSAVREISIAASKSDEHAIGRTVLTLHRVCWITGLFGMMATMAISPLLSQLTFNSSRYTLDIAALGILILLANLTGGQLALLQGMRRIGDMARANIGGAAFSTLSAMVFYYWLGLRGIVPSLISIAAIQLTTAWYFAHRVPVTSVNLTWVETVNEAKGMVKLGVAFMWSGLMASAVGYFTVTLLAREINLDAVGLYSAAFLLSGMSVNFVLGAMGADFYPRLAAVASDNISANKLINEQIEIGLLLAAPALVAALFFAPWFVYLFYTPAFQPAAELMQIYLLGSLARIVSWPVAFLMIAKGKGVIYGLAETLWSFTHITLIYLGLNYFGLTGVAFAFLILNLFVIPHVLYIGRKLTNFKLDASSKKLLLIISGLVIFSYIIVCLSDGLWKNIVAGMILPITSLFCIKKLSQVAGDVAPFKILKSLPLFKKILGIR